MSKKEPMYPITAEQAEAMKFYIEKWQKMLHLMHWRIRVGRKRPVASLAEVEIFKEDHLARVHIGRDWGSNPPKEGDPEKTIIHELLHVLLYDLADSAEKHNSDTVAGLEHAVIVPLTETLYALHKQISPPVSGY